MGEEERGKVGEIEREIFLLLKLLRKKERERERERERLERQG